MKTPGRHACAVALLVAAAVLLFDARPALAGPSYQVPIGPRALGMGGAFGAIADDASALYWNPAGLPRVGHQEISAMHADLFGSGIRDNYASFVLPLSPRHAAGIDWYRSGFDDAELGFGENRIQLGWGWRFHELASAGVTGKYLSRSTELDGTTVRRGSGVGFDLGILVHPHERLRLALSAQDVTDTRVSYANGDGRAEAFPRLYRAGLAVEPHPDLTLAFDSDDRWHAGAELRTLDLFSLRAGLQKDWRSTDGVIWSAGTGIRAGLLRVDYAYVDHPSLGATHHYGASLEFHFNPAQVRIEKVVSRDVFASQLKSYTREPITTLQLRNLEATPLTAKVRFFVPELMTVPSEQEVVLRPRVVQDVAVTAVLSEKALAERGDRPVQADVSVSYQSRRLPRTERRSARFIAYGPGAIDWTAGVGQAAAFVTTRDPAVEDFARRAVRVSAGRELPSGLRNLVHAAAIVDALTVLGMGYVPDPNNPFSTISETERAVDTIAYPAETLARGSGDCDDTSVLLAALLGNVGIGSQFVDVPGHIFLLVDSGVHERHRLALGLDESRYVIADERVWIPLETTALSRGFIEAWRLGLEAYGSWSARGRVTRVDVTDASRRYEPAQPSFVANAGEFDAAAHETRVRADLEALGAWRAEFLGARLGETTPPAEASADALNELAHVYFTAGRLANAREHLERARGRDPESSRTLNNLGNVMAAEGELPGAMELYVAAGRRDSSDAGVWLNLGVVSYVAGDTSAADRALALGVERVGGYREACRLLGITADEEALREGSRSMTNEEMRELLKRAVRKIPPAAPRTAVPAAPPPPGPAPAPARKWVSRTAGGRGAEGIALHEILYWR